MDPRSSAQDLLRCHLCESPDAPMYCDICHIQLCKACVGEHLSDESTEHKVVPFKKRGLNPNCTKHPTQLCELHCEQCDIPICVECVSCGEHPGHKLVGIIKILDHKKESFQKDLEELENFIFPKYQEIASIILMQKVFLKDFFQKLTTAIIKHGEDLHKEINIAIEKLKIDVYEMESEGLFVLNEQTDKVNKSISEITLSIADLKKLLDSNIASPIFAFKSRNAKFRRLPPKLAVSLPRFSPQRINKQDIYQLLGSPSALSIKTEEHGYIVNSPGMKYSFPHRPLANVNVPRIIAEIKTKYGESNILRCVSSFSDNEVWTSGLDNTMRLYNIHGKLLNSIQTKSGKQPADIVVTQNGELIYTDPSDRTVNKVYNTHIQTVIRLQGWKPGFVCSSLYGDILVIMVSDDEKEARVVRYSGAKEKQTIQYDGKGQPLYSSKLRFTKYISENKNLDVCVADSIAGAVVVVNQAGKLRFKYTGPPSNTDEPFDPVGIATDSQSRILTADYSNNRIHILDQDGHFLRNIDNCNLNYPWGICVDSRNNLFVAENETGKVKKIA